MLRVQKGTLPFAEKSESYFVHCCRTDRPGMTHVELLNALIRQITESRQSRPARLESGEWFRQIVLRKVVVAREALVSCQLVINLGGELIAALMAKRHILKSVKRPAGIERYGGFRHELIELVVRRLIKTCCRNDVVGKYGRIGHDQVRLCRGHRDCQAAPVIQRLGKEIGCHSARKRCTRRKIPRTFQVGRHGHRVRRGAFPNPVSLKGNEEEGLVLLDGAAKRRTKLILQIVRLGGVKKSLGV